MCVIAVKYFEGEGWVGAKNRDRNYQPKINIVQSNRKGIQRLYIDDELTRYTEGLNEHGLCVLSAALSVKSDEKEGDKINPADARRGRPDDYMSPDGKTIRDALLLKKPLDAVKLIVERELAGATVVFNEKECYLIEGGFTVKKADVTDETPRDYIYKIKRMENKVGNSVVRTNHGLMLTQLGYQPDSDDEDKQDSRESSEERLRVAKESVRQCKTGADMIDALSISPNEDKFMNPIRLGDTEKGDMVTTGQLMLVPKERTMHYRPLFSHIEVKYSKLNGATAKTYFEIVSSRKLLGFMEWRFDNIQKTI